MNKRFDKNHDFLWIVAAAALLYAVSGGLRSIYGIMLGTIVEETGIGYADVSFTIAVGQLVFGIAQPLFGIVALKKSNKFVLTTGCFLMVVGLLFIPFCTAAWVLMVFFGIMLPVGTGAVSFGIIMGAVTPKLGERRAVAASGLISASSGMGSIVFSPVMQGAFSAVGLRTTMIALAACVMMLIPISLIVSGKGKKESPLSIRHSEKKGIANLMKEVVHSRSYLFLMIGFFTCGFHMAIIETHLFSQILSYGIKNSIAAIGFSIYGFASVAGALASGFFSSRIRMKYVVGTLYGSRMIFVLLFLLLPKTVPVVLCFVTLLGLTGSATVVPTSGLVGKLFGSENLATLFGIVFVSHQCGSFLSAWLGGKCLAMTGSYTLIWITGAALSFLAMSVSYCIEEEKAASDLK